MKIYWFYKIGETKEITILATEDLTELIKTLARFENCSIDEFMANFRYGEINEALDIVTNKHFKIYLD